MPAFAISQNVERTRPGSHLETHWTDRGSQLTAAWLQIAVTRSRSAVWPMLEFLWERKSKTTASACLKTSHASCCRSGQATAEVYEYRPVDIPVSRHLRC